jgi:hypothetical protein
LFVNDGVSALSVAERMLLDQDIQPDEIHQREILGRISQVALRYEGHLPDFSCTQLTDRNRDDSGTDQQWKHQDTLEEAASYLDGRASFNLVTINGKSPGWFHPFENGLGSEGILSAALVPTHIFGTRVHARFNWLREETREGKRLYVFAYEVPPFLNLKQGSKDFVVGFHGFFYADPETAMILTRHQEMDSPPGYRFPQYITDIEYGPVTMSGQEMVFAHEGFEKVREGRHLMRNEVQFVNCRKYSADSRIKFAESK